MTATNEQLSNNGVLPKLTLAPKPTGPTVAPRVEGAKTIAEVQQQQQAKEEEAFFKQYGFPHQNVLRREIANKIQFDPKKESCEGRQDISQSNLGKWFCLGKVTPKTSTSTNKIEEVGQKAWHPYNQLWHSGGSALINPHVAALAKELPKGLQKAREVAGETLEAGKALLGIKGK
jgi:hypothetical protein